MDTLVTLCKWCHGRFGNNPGEVPSAGFSRALVLRRFAIEAGLADPRACLQNELFMHYLERVMLWLDGASSRLERVLLKPNALKSLLRPRSPAFDELGLSFMIDRGASLDVDASLAALARRRVIAVGDIEVTARAFAAWWRRGRFRVRFAADGEVESMDLGPLPRTARLLWTLEELAAQAQRAPREAPPKG